MNIQKTEGLVAAPFTPFLPDGGLNLGMVEPYVAHLAVQGVRGAFVCGTTGEGMAMTVPERRAVAERWVAASPDNFRVFVHVGHTVLEDCRALAAHAGGIGAHGVACMAPCFFRPPDVPSLVEWCARVAAAAPTTPFYYYHIPSMTGVSLPVAEFLDRAASRIPTLAGIKFTFEDLDDLQECLACGGGRYDILFGRDEMLLSGLRAGVRGAVGSTYNFAAPLFNELWAAHGRGDADTAERLQRSAVRLIEAFVGCGASPLAAFKWLMGRTGVDCGPVRLPLRCPTSAQKAVLESAIEESGILTATA
jgi:N-acetylneuraminate lyase